MSNNQQGYQIHFDPEQACLLCSGVMRLNPTEYSAIADTLNQAAAAATDRLQLDLRGLTALNSSGITTFARFLLSLRRRTGLRVLIRGSRQIPWQPKSLANLQLILPSLELSWDD